MSLCVQDPLTEIHFPSRKDISDQCIRAQGQDEAWDDAHIEPQRQQLRGESGVLSIILLRHT